VLIVVLFLNSLWNISMDTKINSSSAFTFSGSVHHHYEECLGPMFFEPYALEVAERIKGLFAHLDFIFSIQLKQSFSKGIWSANEGTNVRYSFHSMAITQ
jgi:hypothetical protein